MRDEENWCWVFEDNQSAEPTAKFVALPVIPEVYTNFCYFKYNTPRNTQYFITFLNSTIKNYY